MSLHDCAVQACMQHLRLQDYTEVEEFDGHIVARNDGALVIVTVAVVDYFEVVSSEPLREREEVAFRYLASHDLGSAVVRFDDIQLRICSESGGFIRHYVNCLPEFREGDA